MPMESRQYGCHYGWLIDDRFGERVFHHFCVFFIFFQFIHRTLDIVFYLLQQREPESRIISLRRQTIPKKNYCNSFLQITRFRICELHKLRVIIKFSFKCELCDIIFLFVEQCRAL